MTDSVQPHRRQPTRLPRLWDSPGKNTGVGCHCLLRTTSEALGNTRSRETLRKGAILVWKPRGTSKTRTEESGQGVQRRRELSPEEMTPGKTTRYRQDSHNTLQTLRDSLTSEQRESSGRRPLGLEDVPASRLESSQDLTRHADSSDLGESKAQDPRDPQTLLEQF